MLFKRRKPLSVLNRFLNFIYPNNDFKLFFFEKFVDQIDEIYIAIDTDTYDLETNSILEKLEVSYM